MLSWDEITTGTSTGRNKVIVSNEEVDEYLSAMEFSHPLFSGSDNLYGKRVVPPDLIPKKSMSELIQDYCTSKIGDNIRAKQYFKFMKPVFVGVTITGAGKIFDKYEKRGRKFVTFEAAFRDETGDVVIVDRRTQLILGEEFSPEKKK